MLTHTHTETHTTLKQGNTRSRVAFRGQNIPWIPMSLRGEQRYEVRPSKGKKNKKYKQQFQLPVVNRSLKIARENNVKNNMSYFQPDK